MEKINNFDSLVFKWLVIPGIIIEVLLAIIFCVPTDLNLNLLTRPIGGPPGLAIQFGMMLCVVLILAYLSVACVYTIILPCKYLRRAESFLDSMRRFSIFSIHVLLMLDFIVICGWIEFIRWNYVDILNVPVVCGLSVLAFIMTGLFIYWSVKIYRQQCIRFFSLKTLEGLAIFLGSLVLVIGLLWILL